MRAPPPPCPPRSHSCLVSLTCYAIARAVARATLRPSRASSPRRALARVRRLTALCVVSRHRHDRTLAVRRPANPHPNPNPDPDPDITAHSLGGFLLMLVVIAKSHYVWLWYIVGIGSGTQLLVELYGLSSVAILQKRRW